MTVCHEMNWEDYSYVIPIHMRMTYEYEDDKWIVLSIHLMAHMNES